MNKEDYITKYGKEAYEKIKRQSREWHLEFRAEHRERKKQLNMEWRERNPKKILINHCESSRKDGKYYEKKRQYQMTGIPHIKNLIRQKHLRKWTPYKKVIAPESQIHHEWIPNSAEYRGIALVEKDQHMHGFVDVIQILEGEITLLTEDEIRMDDGIK